ncbi:MAG: hypothetical protein KTR27_08755 [Leptolyngbyaceae cyanobacterium MAG.088]|nr:hypothetical protein [Leptolyngbyaceae cyanobacterium MAG.088]
MTAPSLRLLLSTLLDYTGLLSSTAPALPTAVAAYERYSASSHRWMLGRLVLPLSQLSQFEDCLDHLDRTYSAAFWPLSIVLEPSHQALDRLAPWLKKQDRFTISALEFKLGNTEANCQVSASAIASLLPHLPPHSDLFFDVPLDTSLPTYLDVLQGTRAAVNIYTGGLTKTHSPNSKTLAQGIVACANAHIPFKTTPVSACHPLANWQTLSNGTAIATPGFLNIALAAACAYGYGVTAAEIETILQINTPENLIFSAQEIICHSPFYSQEATLSNVVRHLPLEVLANVRSRYFLGVSSYSFQTPIADLCRLGFLPEVLPMPSYAFSS